MRDIKLCMQVLQAARRLSRAAHAERCHWSEGCNNNVGGSRQERRATTKVMLGVSLRARWDAILVNIIKIKVINEYFIIQTSPFRNAAAGLQLQVNEYEIGDIWPTHPPTHSQMRRQSCDLKFI